MTLEDLHGRALLLKREAQLFCDQSGFQTAADLMVNLESFVQSGVLRWARDLHRPSKNRPILDKVAAKIREAGNAAEVYLYAKTHGVEAAMIWKLSK